MKKLIAYDLDGTLVDTREDIILAANHMLTSLGHSPISGEAIKSYVGRGLHDLVKSCLRATDEKEVEKGAKVYRRYYGEHMMDHTCLYPGAKETLEHFKNRRQMVVTNKPSPFSEQMLEKLGVAGYLSVILTGSSDHPPKPDPTGLLRVLEREKIAPEDALLVGDSEVDLETGRRAGMETVLIAHGFVSRDALESRKPEWLVGNFEEFLALAREQSW